MHFTGIVQNNDKGRIIKENLRYIGKKAAYQHCGKLHGKYQTLQIRNIYQRVKKNHRKYKTRYFIVLYLLKIVK